MSSKYNKESKVNREIIVAFVLGLFILFSYSIIINKISITGSVVYDETSTLEEEDLKKGGCSCNGIRFVDLFSDYSFSDGIPYNVTAEVFKGSSTSSSQLIDSETISFSSLPQTSIDNNPGDEIRGNLIIESINQSGILIRFHNKSKGRLLGDNTFRIIIDSNILGPDTIHLSCSQPIDIGDIFGDFEVKDIDKILSGSSCHLGNVNLISPADNSTDSDGNINFEYNVYDPNQAINYCELIIDETVYQTDYSIAENIVQEFNQSLPNGAYEWSVKCITSNGYEIESETRTINVGGTNQIKGVITDSNKNPVSSDVNVYYTVNDISGALAATNSFETWARGGNGSGDASIVADSSTASFSIEHKGI